MGEDVALESNSSSDANVELVELTHSPMASL